MTLQDIAARFTSGARGIAFDKAVKSGADRVNLYSLAGSAAAVAIKKLESDSIPVIVVGDSLDDAGYLYHDLCRLASEDAVAIFPAPTNAT